ncbi:hypothetical protein NXV20_11555 [Bacteroides thetaiotaomicron]|uniref:hypothetical protein n=1 Tax=Bacteroides thetaiotaomicron TaxID=818 RepID=UPI002165C71F|nr:hypothetical protein [Bacteroides thetaiotaomicron]MCS2826846.1 hypothetical protein [Bacteroides thetaiotaomicron]
MATFNGCTSLAGVKLKGNVPPSLEYSVFGNSTFPIYVTRKEQIILIPVICTFRMDFIGF